MSRINQKIDLICLDHLRFFIRLCKGHFHTTKPVSKLKKTLNKGKEDNEDEYDTGEDQSEN